jgi:opacity protein-like surface antigen
MKKFLFTLMLVTGLAGAGQAADGNNEVKVKQSTARERQAKTYVEAALAAAYGEPSDGQWQVTAITRGYQQAAFIQQGIRKSLFFSPDNARMLASIEIVPAGELPEKMTRKLARKYKGYQIAQVIKYYDGDTMYFISLKKNLEAIMVGYAR